MKIPWGTFQQPSLEAPDGYTLSLVFVPSSVSADWNVGVGQNCILDPENEENFLGIVE